VTAAPWLAALPWLLGPLAVLVRLRDSRFLHEYAPAARTGTPRVSVIIPARDEARNIARCLGSLLTTALDDVEFIVVDDHSSDDTAQIARDTAAGDPRVRITTPPPLPADWFGKQWACQHGASIATGHYLLFTDADTWHSADALPRAIAALEARGADLLSVAGAQELGSFWEKVVQPVMFVSLFAWFGGMEAVSRSTDPRRKIANGQYIVVRRSTYESLQGHAPVRGYVAEDLMLAQTWTAQGKAVHLVVGQEQLRVRMYQSLAEIVAGWGKNIWAGGRHLAGPTWAWPLLRLLMPLGPLAGAVPVLLLLLGTTGLLAPWWASVGAWAYLFQSAVWMLLFTFTQLRPGWALLYPLGCMVTSGIFALAAWRGDRTVWKGRAYTSE
jgi:chlorobactene glucosyltransferase